MDSDNGGGDVLQLPRLRRHSQSLVTLSRPGRLGALTRAITSKRKWRFSLVVSPPPPPPAPATAPALPPSSSPSLTTTPADADGEEPSPSRAMFVTSYRLLTYCDSQPARPIYYVVRLWLVLCDTWNWSDDNDTVSGIEYRDTIAIPEPEMD